MTSNNKIVWRNGAGYITKSEISYRVFYPYNGNISHCYPLTEEGLQTAKNQLEERLRVYLEREDDYFELYH